ncbi:hypothetical protein MMC10_003254 [Thelotrema lepadinum]|nr:hypothetical protein [Thelotrema lepadinum]
MTETYQSTSECDHSGWELYDQLKQSYQPIIPEGFQPPPPEQPPLQLLRQAPQEPPNPVWLDFCWPKYWPPHDTPISLPLLGGNTIKCTLQPIKFPEPVFLLQNLNWLTLDCLYGFGGKYSWWWKLLDRLRYHSPAWFVPRKAIFKIYMEHEDSPPYARCAMEDRSYNRLRAEQGRWFPRSYGLAVWHYQFGSILQRVPGEALNKAQINAARLRKDLPIIVDKLNKANVLGDIHSRNLIDDGNQIWLIDFDAAWETDPELVTGANTYALEQIFEELDERY